MINTHCHIPLRCLHIHQFETWFRWSTSTCNNNSQYPNGICVSLSLQFIIVYFIRNECCVSFSWMGAWVYDIAVYSVRTTTTTTTKTRWWCESISSQNRQNGYLLWRNKAIRDADDIFIRAVHGKLLFRTVFVPFPSSTDDPWQAL